MTVLGYVLNRKHVRQGRYEHSYDCQEKGSLIVTWCIKKYLVCSLTFVALFKQLIVVYLVQYSLYPYNAFLVQPLDVRFVPVENRN